MTKEEKATVVEGLPIDLGRKENMVNSKNVNSECCPICALNLKPNYTVR